MLPGRSGHTSPPARTAPARCPSRPRARVRSAPCQCCPGSAAGWRAISGAPAPDRRAPQALSAAAMVAGVFSAGIIGLSFAGSRANCLSVVGGSVGVSDRLAAALLPRSAEASPRTASCCWMSFCARVPAPAFLGRPLPTLPPAAAPAASRRAADRGPVVGHRCCLGPKCAPCRGQLAGQLVRLVVLLLQRPLHFVQLAVSRVLAGRCRCLQFAGHLLALVAFLLERLPHLSQVVAGLRCRRDRQPDIIGEVADIERPASGQHNEEGGDQSDLGQPPPRRASVVQVAKRRRQDRWLVARGHCRFVSLRERSRRDFVGRPCLRGAKSIRCARPASTATTLGGLFGCRARRFRSAGGGLRRWIRRHRRQHCDSISNALEAAQHVPPPLSPMGYHLMHALNDAPSSKLQVVHPRCTIVRECLGVWAAKPLRCDNIKSWPIRLASPLTISDLVNEMQPNTVSGSSAPEVVARCAQKPLARRGRQRHDQRVRFMHKGNRRRKKVTGAT
jgi:hypothetical protein